MKKITNEQIKAIKDAFFNINAPVKLYAEVAQLLDTLPEELSPTTSTPEVDMDKNKTSTKKEPIK